MKTSRVVISTVSLVKCTLLSLLLSGATAMLHGEVTLETQAKITDFGLHFNGKKLTRSTLDQVDTGPEKYDYFFGRSISAHGDCVKTYKNFVFMSWYRGGKNDRRVMLSRYDTDTGEVATIAFPHRHIGYKSDPLIGESHNTIGIAVSPLNGTIHMLYDMHGSSYRNYRYSYSEVGAASAPHAEFTLDLFKKDTTSRSTGDDDYIHSYMTGNPADDSKFGGLTYPQFFTNDDGVLIMYMRKGGSNNGAYQFNRYDAANERWTNLVDFNVQNAKTNHGNAYNWGLYGSMKYINGKLRVAFQQRTDIKSDRYLYQNGVYYAYSDDQEGKGQWHNHEGEPMTFPLVNTDEIKVFEPGDYISHTEKDSVYIVSPFDFTVTAKGDIHIISKVRSTDRSRSDYKEVYIHSYKPHDADAFVYDTNFSGGDALYTSGDYIYMIGLKSGRPFIKKAKGGTHEFETVYQAEGGLTFDHGVVYIDKGKVYYYLLEKGSSSALPLHLQIIDLGIENDLPADTEIDAAVQIANDGSIVIRVDRIGNITFELVWSRNLVHWTRLDSQTEESEKTVDFIVPPEVMDAPAFFKVGVEQ